MGYNIGMQYDPFQQKAIDYIKENHSVIVSAPTGSGKTAIAEYVINDCLAKDRHAIYTAPIKALSNQKFRDFAEIFKDKIGILTGDVSINPHAPILIMTTEIFRNKVLEEEGGLEKHSWIIFDEIHYLYDYERGTVWEESLIFLPSHMNILGLSATIPNIKQFSDWISSIHKKDVKIVVEENRPVPLHFFFQSNNEVVDRIERLRKTRAMRPNKLSTLINYIKERSGFPCIYFVFGRRRSEYLAAELYGFNFLSAEEAKAYGLVDEVIIGKKK